MEMFPLEGISATTGLRCFEYSVQFGKERLKAITHTIIKYDERSANGPIKTPRLSQSVIEASVYNIEPEGHTQR